MFYYVKNNKVYVIEKFKVLPEIIELEKRLPADKLEKVHEYIHFCYSKKSAYHSIVLKDRQKIVCRDRFGSPQLYETIEKIKEALAVIDRMNEFQFTENETFLAGVRKKISEYLKHWEETPITSKNSDEMKEQLKGAKDLLKVKKEMEEMVYEEIRRLNADKDSGKKLFEEE